jgi:hypothetical protein
MVEHETSLVCWHMQLAAALCSTFLCLQSVTANGGLHYSMLRATNAARAYVVYTAQCLALVSPCHCCHLHVSSQLASCCTMCSALKAAHWLVVAFPSKHSVHIEGAALAYPVVAVALCVLGELHCCARTI